MVEFQLDVMGLSFRDVIADSVTQDRTRAAMMKWYEVNRPWEGEEGER
jgi:hypothetical protein